MKTSKLKQKKPKEIFRRSKKLNKKEVDISKLHTTSQSKTTLETCSENTLKKLNIRFLTKSEFF